jgi:outer membrane protein OmpA-like peptidoglycan-associated protein
MKRITCLFLLCISFLPAKSQEEQKPQLIKSIFFGGGSYYIDYQQVQDLYDFLDSIDGLEQYDIIIHSHTDNIGSIEFNELLSKMRSKAVLQQILEKGIPSEMISIRDFGELNPLYDNATWEGKLSNRRVDVILKPPSL